MMEILKCAILCISFYLVHSYEVPRAKFQAIYPKGLKVSIQDDGFTLAAFHGKLNEEMDGLEGGTWSADISKAENGEWVFRDNNVELKIGDKIYFWTYIIKDGLGYRQDDGEWTVDGAAAICAKDGAGASGASTPRAVAGAAADAAGAAAGAASAAAGAASAAAGAASAAAGAIRAAAGATGAASAAVGAAAGADGAARRQGAGGAARKAGAGGATGAAVAAGSVTGSASLRRNRGSALGEPRGAGGTSPARDRNIASRVSGEPCESGGSGTLLSLESGWERCRSYVDELGNPVSVVDGTTAAPTTQPPSTTTETPTTTTEAPTTTTEAPKPKPTTEASQDPYKYPCEISLSKVTTPGFVCKGQLLFEDTFDGDIDKGRIWTPEIKMPGPPDYPFNVYLYDKNIRTRDGKLIIEPMTLESKYGDGFIWQALDLTLKCTGKIGTPDCYREAAGPEILPPIITGKINSKRSFSFKYGKIEVVAKMPLGNWLIPEIQLEPRFYEYGTRRYASGLLRIALVKGNVEFAKKLVGGPVMSDTEPFRSMYLKEKVGYDNWNKDYHNYTLVWKPDIIELFVDGDKYGEVDPGEGFYQEARKHHVRAASRWLTGSAMAPFDELFYISLGLRVGGIHEFPDAHNKPWKNRSAKAMLQFWQNRDEWFPTWFADTSPLRVDSVRVYAL
ncbi:unnamed protein product [Leptosia nina]|uniref:Beta-1,3-glucan-binding protein n=1 Tax=Leptosia nina TaxID=320188 RepID=A0AAV1J682_9NEOP